MFLIVLVINSIPAQEVNSSGRDSVITPEIVVESNRLKMTNAEAPNKIQVIDENVILKMNGSRLPDILNMSDAVFIKDYGFNSGSKTISLNATQSEHTLILIDGIRLNSRQNAQYDLSLLDMDNVSRIEISKGGSSALYGSEAIGGVINIITKQFYSTHPIGFNFKVGVGSYGYRKFFGKFSHSFEPANFKKITYNLSYSDERAKNNYDYNIKNGLIEVSKQKENSDFNTQSLNLDVNSLNEDKSLLKLFANYSHFERGVPGIDIGYSTGTARQIDYNAITGIAYSRKIHKDLYLKSDLSYKYSLQKYFDPTTYNLSVKINSFYKLNTIASNSTISFTPSEKFNIETGTELSFNDIVSNETDKGNLMQAAVFAITKFESKFKGISRISIYPSIRYDYFSNISEHNVVTGKIGLNIKPFNKADLNLKSSFGNNFRAPTFNELYWRDLGNKNLKPEKSLSFDAGIYYKFNFGGINEFEVSYYNIYTKDRIVWTPVSGTIWRPINIQKVSSEGIDVSLRSEISMNRTFKANIGINYTYGSSVKKKEDYPGDPTYNKQLIYLPKEMVKTSIMINYLTTSKILKYVSFSLFYNFSTRRYTNFENTQFVPRYDVLDGNLGFGTKLYGVETGIRFIVNNIMNEDYAVLPGFPMPLRNFKIELNIKY